MVENPRRGALQSINSCSLGNFEALQDYQSKA